MMTEATWLIVGLVSVSAFSIFFSWATRLSPSVSRDEYKLDDLEIAYLFGGRLRLIEVAFFFLLRDGWIKGDRTSQFTARFDDAPESLAPTQRELLAVIAEKGSTTIHDLKTFSLPSLASIERRLARKLLILPPRRVSPYHLIARLPLGLVILLAVKVGGDAFLRKEPLYVPLLVAFFAWQTVRLLNQKFSFRTAAGDRLLAILRQEIQDRFRHRNEVNEAGRPYDRLWNLHDDVLTKGLASMVGSAPFMSIVEDPNAPKSEASAPISYTRD